MHLYFYFLCLFKELLLTKEIKMSELVTTDNGSCGSFEFEGKKYSIYISESEIVTECLKDHLPLNELIN